MSSAAPPELAPAFEFRLDDPVAMLPADELFSGGRLVPLRPSPPEIHPLSPPSPEKDLPSPSPSPSPSPRAPKCSSRWRELLGLKAKSGGGGGPRSSIKQFLRRDPKSGPADPSMSLSLLRDSDSESISLSSRRSLSSSSSSSGEDVPRLSLDADKPAALPILLSRTPHPPRVRTGTGTQQPRSVTPEPRAATVDSPRMNASGRVVFQGLDRSSSSPGSFNGGPKARNWAMERSYSAGVRVAPVLNVPAFGLGNLFRKEREGARSAATGGGSGGKAKAEKKGVESN